MMIDHSYMAIIVDGDVKYKCNNKRNWNQCNEFLKKNYKNISFFFFIFTGFEPAPPGYSSLVNALDWLT